MNKAEEQQFSILTSELRNERSERQEAQKKAILLERENAVLKSKHADMQRRLNEKMDEVADMVRQMAGYMMGKGPVTLSDSLRNAIVADVREEFESKLREEREAHAREVQSMKDQFAVMLAAKDNEIARLRAKDGDDGASAHGTTTGGSIPDGMTPEDRIRQLEQQKAKYAAEAYGVRLARTLTTFANCKAYNIDPYKYLCDVFRRIKNTAKDELVNLVAHRWQPQMAVAAY